MDLVLTNSSNNVIKSLSTYRDQIVMLYGNANDTASVFLYRFRDVNVTNLSGPLFGIDFEKGEAIEHDSLDHIFPGLRPYINKYEIVSLLYFNDQLVICFFRDVLKDKVSNSISNTKTVLFIPLITTPSLSDNLSSWTEHLCNP